MRVVATARKIGRLARGVPGFRDNRVLVGGLQTGRPRRVIFAATPEKHAQDGTDGVSLRSMGERAGLLDGDLNLDGEPGRGTWVEVSILRAGRH